MNIPLNYSLVSSNPDLAEHPGMRTLSLLVRFALGGVFLIAAIGKLNSLTTFAGEIANYGILPESWSAVAAVSIAWSEMVIAVLLYAGAAVRGAALLSGALLVTFLIAIISAMARGLEIGCGCFAGSDQTVGWPKVIEDVALLAGSIFLVYFPRSWAMVGDLWGREEDRAR